MWPRPTSCTSVQGGHRGRTASPELWSGAAVRIEILCPQCEGIGTVGVEARACSGCGIKFAVKDKRQMYCGPKCRHATNQRAYYSRWLTRTLNRHE